jgi:predicted lipid carrier protein YhbT
VEVISRLANHLLRDQAISRRLAPIEGRCLCLAISDTGNLWRFRVRAGRLFPQPAGETSDVSIQGELADFLLLATRGEDPDTLFFARRLSLEGDTETGLFIKNQLDALEFDWETHVNAVAGPRAAIGPVTSWLDGISADAAPINCAGTVLSQERWRSRALTRPSMPCPPRRASIRCTSR